MKKLLLSTTLAATAAITGAALADTHTELFRAEPQAQEIRASDFIGMSVYAAETGATATERMGVQDDWEDVGEINDVILTRDGDVDAVLVDIGGFLGIGERQVAMQMDRISFVSDGQSAEEDDFFLVIPASRANLEDAPEYSSMTTSGDAGRTQGDEITTETAMSDTTAAEDAVTGDAPVAGAEETAMGMEREGYMVAGPEALTADALTGTAVYDAEDEWIGDVSELVLSDAGEIEQVVIDVGGFLGIGEKPVALAYDEIDILQTEDGDDLRVFVSMTEDELEAMPTYSN